MKNIGKNISGENNLESCEEPACLGMIRCGGWDADGKCPECGQLTYDGKATNCCEYSGESCSVCRSQPCDMAC